MLNSETAEGLNMLEYKLSSINDSHQSNIRQTWFSTEVEKGQQLTAVFSRYSINAHLKAK